MTHNIRTSKIILKGVHTLYFLTAKLTGHSHLEANYFRLQALQVGRISRTTSRFLRGNKYPLYPRGMKIHATSRSLLIERKTTTLVAKLTGHSHTEINYYNTAQIYKLSPTRIETTGLSHTAKERTTTAEGTHRVIQNETCNFVLNK